MCHNPSPSEHVLCHIGLVSHMLLCSLSIFVSLTRMILHPFFAFIWCAFYSVVRRQSCTTKAIKRETLVHI